MLNLKIFIIHPVANFFSLGYFCHFPFSTCSAPVPILTCYLGTTLNTLWFPCADDLEWAWQQHLGVTTPSLWWWAGSVAVVALLAALLLECTCRNRGNIVAAIKDACKVLTSPCQVCVLEHLYEWH